MAITEKWLATHYNRPDFEIFDYNIYAVCGDGWMMEGIASEAVSLAAHRPGRAINASDCLGKALFVESKMCISLILLEHK